MRVILPGLLHACNCQIPRDRYLKVLYPGSTGAVSWLYNSGCYYTISESPVTRPSRALTEELDEEAWEDTLALLESVLLQSL